MRRALGAVGARLGRAAVAWRRAAGARAVETVVRGVATGGRLLPEHRPARHGIVVERDVPYLDRTGPENTLDVYRPAGPPPWPVALYAHGGGFQILSKDTHWLMALRLARRGYLTFNINYRLAPKHPFPAALVDAGCALTWVVRRAAELGGDVGQLVLAGESAGANLVTALTVACCYEREEPWSAPLFALGVVPRAVVPACGLLQVSRIERLVDPGRQSLFLRDRMRTASAAYLGSSLLSPERRLLADPLLVLEQAGAPGRPLPVFFAPVGTADPLLDDTRRLAAAVERLGGTCDARYYAGEHHAFHAMPWRPAARQCWDDIFAFLDEHVGPARRSADLA